MLTPERHRIIIELVEAKKTVKLQELVEATNSSESTVRRDLSQLESKNKLKRVHGGASLLHQKSTEPSNVEKSTKYLKEKEAIAKYAASLIRDGDCIFLEAGTTVFQMIQYIIAKDIKVVTNGLTHIDALLQKNIDTYVTGGNIKQKTNALIGPRAVEGLSQYRFDKTFIGINGIHLKHGFTTPDHEEARMKSLAIQLGQDVYVLADESKFNESTFAYVAELNEATVITNGMLDDILGDFKDKTIIEVVKI